MLDNLVQLLGTDTSKPLIPLDNHKLFVRSGLTVMASLAGIGKTSFMIEQSAQWELDGYKILHVNFDNSTSYSGTLHSPPKNLDDLEKFLKLMAKDTDPKDIIIIDSLKAMLTSMELDGEVNRDVMPVLQRFRSIISNTGVSIIMLHHCYKPKNVKSIRASFHGARAIEEQCDSGFIYMRDGDDMSVEIVKSRLGHSREDIFSIGD